MKGIKTLRRLAYSDLFWIFIAGSVLGFVLEGIWHWMRKGFWESHTATVWGPFCIIYGIGAVVLYSIAMLVKTDNIFIIFILSAIAGSLSELMAGVFQEMAFGTYSWNYSAHMLNLNGKISMEMSFMWGVLGTVFIKLAVPFINNMLDMMHGEIWSVVVVCLSVFMAVNLSVTGAALVRWKHRYEGEEPSNVIERLLDEKYNDEEMKKIFPNMKRFKKDM